MAKDTIGHVTCEDCGNDSAHVRVAKTGRLYYMCGQCKAQHFTRSDDGSEKLKAKTRAIKPDNQPGPTDDGKQDGKPKRNFWNDDFLGLGGK